MYARMHVDECVFVCTCVRLYVCIYFHVCICMNVCLYGFVYAYLDMCMCLYVCVHVCGCVFVWVHACLGRGLPLDPFPCWLSTLGQSSLCAVCCGSSLFSFELCLMGGTVGLPSENPVG